MVVVVDDDIKDVTCHDGRSTSITPQTMDKNAATDEDEDDPGNTLIIVLKKTRKEIDSRRSSYEILGAVIKF